MKVAVAVWASTCVLVMVSSLEPIEEGDQRSEYMDFENRQANYQRDQRLSENYYAISPCAAAAAARSYNPNTVYQNGLGPGLMPDIYDYGIQGYTGNMYRSEDPYSNNMEALSFSDMNFLQDAPQARSNYRIAPSSLLLKGANAANINNQLVQQVAPAVYGIFPNGNTGGCNVPLFFSCTPSIVSGRVARSEPQIYNTPAIAYPDAYRGVANYIHAVGARNAEQIVHDHITPDKSDNLNIKENPT